MLLSGYTTASHIATICSPGASERILSVSRIFYSGSLKYYSRAALQSLKLPHQTFNAGMFSEIVFYRALYGKLQYDYALAV